MDWIKKQERLQERVENQVFELEEEFNLGVNTFPEVIYLGRGSSFEDLGLPWGYEEDFEYIREGYFEAMPLEKKRIILAGKNSEVLGEEAMHFYHRETARISYKRRNINEEGAITIIKEMIGYFGSLLLGEDRNNPYSQIPDPYYENKKYKEFCRENSEWVDGAPENFLNHLMHKLGYELGDLLYARYSNGDFSRHRMRNLLRNRFERKNSAVEKFIKLRNEFGIPMTQYILSK